MGTANHPTPPTRVNDFLTLAKQVFSEEYLARIYGEDDSPAGIKDSRNEAAFEQIYLRPRVLRDMSVVDLSCTVLGQELAMPILIGPSGGQARVHHEGEVATARAAGRLGTVMVLSTFSSRPIEAVTAATAGPVWFQLYFFRDRGLTRFLVEQAETAGCEALVLTVDVNGGADEWLAATPDRIENLGFEQGVLRDVSIEDHPFKLLDDRLTWSDLEWLQGITSMPLVVKGVQTAEDAHLCARSRVSAVVVSNHGSYGLGAARPSLEALAEISAAEGDSLELMMDGGIRDGEAVLKALALGARAILVGRPIFWGLAVGGEAGVRDLLEILRDQLRNAMILSGVTCVKRIPRELLAVPLASPLHPMLKAADPPADW